MMNRRSWLTSLLALPLLPSVLRAFEYLTGGTRKGGSNGRIELIVHASKDVWWSCHAEDGTHVSFIGSQDMGPAELKERTRLAMEAKKS